MILRFTGILFLTLVCMPGFSADTVKATISSSIHSVFPDLEITRIRPSGIDGLYEVMMGADVIYATKDGRYVFQGDLIDLQQRRNVTEDIRSHVRVGILNKIPNEEIIEFSPVKAKHSLFVFTDITCGYCRKLHRDMPEINRQGIAVKYLAFPRAGVGSSSFEDMESVWCSSDKNKALTEAKLNGKIKNAKCKNPVATQFMLGRDIGVRGTPAIYLENGKYLSGYLPPDELIKALENKDN